MEPKLPNIQLDTFNGPLDLLLQLIDREQIDIFDIPITEITDQFLSVIAGMPEDMEMLSSFLSVASELLDIKCRMLLPKEKQDEEADEEDPRMQLALRLFEYKLYRESGKALLSMHGLAEKCLYRQNTLRTVIHKKEDNTVDYKTLTGNRTAADLKRIFSASMRRKEARQDPVRASFGKIEREPVDSRKSEQYIRDYLQEHPVTTFSEITQKNKEKEETVVDFLLLLEMAKAGDVTLDQKKTFQNISVQKL